MALTTADTDRSGTGGTVGYPAGLGRRMGAGLYDALLIIIGVWGSTLFVWVVANDGQAVTGWPVPLLLASELILFYVFFWSREGQTLGMAAWRIRLVSNDGGKPALSQILIRLGAAPLSIAPLGLGYLWFYIGAEKQTWHDRLSDTMVVYIPQA